MDKELKINYIKLLDSYRAIAILMVLFFHYFSRWTEIYPYESKYDFFSLGKYGVQFFFMISGFVIFLTLENTKGYIDFWKKRFNRLFPSMLIASLLTLIFFRFLDSNNMFPSSHSIKNLFASLTFVKPDLLSSIFFRKIEFDYISGAYWSLWLEVQFYFYISALFYSFKEKFLSLFLSLSAVLSIINILLSNIYSTNRYVIFLKSFLRTFELPSALCFFVLGVLFYLLYKNTIYKVKITNEMKMYLVINILFVFFSYRDSFFKLTLFSCFLTLFYLLVYFPFKLKFLENPALYSIGLSSYFLYLIHENIGVFIISKFKFFKSFFDFSIPVFVMIFFVLISIAYTYFVEKNIKKMIKLN